MWKISDVSVGQLVRTLVSIRNCEIVIKAGTVCRIQSIDPLIIYDFNNPLAAVRVSSNWDIEVLWLGEDAFEFSDFSLGDTVRLIVPAKASCYHGWGNITHGTKGEVVSLFRDNKDHVVIGVRYANREFDWNGKPGEFRLLRKAKVPEGPEHVPTRFYSGDKVVCWAANDVTNPNYGSVGTVRHCSHRIVTVDFLGYKGPYACWEGFASNLVLLRPKDHSMLKGTVAKEVAVSSDKQHDQGGKEMKLSFEKLFGGPIGVDKTDMFKLSLLGLAAKNTTGSYVVVNENRELIDVNEMVIDAEGMVYRLPSLAKEIQIGDIILNQGSPVFVQSIDDNGVRGIEYKTGTQATIVPFKNIFNQSFCIKVISLIKSGNSLTNPGNLLPLMLLGGNKGMENMLPLLMLSQGNLFGGNAPAEPGNFNQLSPWMFFLNKDDKNGTADKDSMLPLLLMSQGNFFSGENVGNINQMMLPLLLMGKGNLESILPLILMGNMFNSQTKPAAE